VNDLNQITARTIPRVMQFQGQIHPDATLTLIEDDPVTGVSTNVQRLSGDPHWLAEADYSQATDPNDPQYGEFTLEGILAEVGHNDSDAIAEAQVTALLKTNPEALAYDDDGNLLSYGLWDYEWDGENRLTGIEHKSTLAAFFAANNLDRKRLEFAYDSQSRRIQKDTFEWDGQDWLLLESRRFLYDNWNPLVELRSTDGQSYAVFRTYLWGLDLAEQANGHRPGSPLGAQAGGVGGLLALRVADSSKTLLPICDGHGNIMGLVDSDTGTVVAEYEYSPFGETLRATGPMADQNPFRFSTKYTDSETGLLYYGLRYYDPVTGRWPSRDPIGEQGGLNLYGFNWNNPLSWIDVLGGMPLAPGQIIEHPERPNRFECVGGLHCRGGQNRREGSFQFEIGTLKDVFKPTGVNPNFSIESRSIPLPPVGIFTTKAKGSVNGSVYECCLDGKRGLQFDGSVGVAVTVSLGEIVNVMNPSSSGGGASGNVSLPSGGMPTCEDELSLSFDLRAFGTLAYFIAETELSGTLGECSIPGGCSWGLYDVSTTTTVGVGNVGAEAGVRGRAAIGGKLYWLNDE
jgi:RHS repeat-associated protein